MNIKDCISTVNNIRELPERYNYLKEDIHNQLEKGKQINNEINKNNIYVKEISYEELKRNKIYKAFRRSQQFRTIIFDLFILVFLFTIKNVFKTPFDLTSLLLLMIIAFFVSIGIIINKMAFIQRPKCVESVIFNKISKIKEDKNRTTNKRRITKINKYGIKIDNEINNKTISYIGDNDKNVIIEVKSDELYGENITEYMKSKKYHKPLRIGDKIICFWFNTNMAYIVRKDLFYQELN